MNRLQTTLPTVTAPTVNGHKEAAQQIATAGDVAKLEADLRKARAENTRLRKQLRIASAHVRMADQAKVDAMLFVGDRLANRDVSMAAMNARHGVSRRRWENARAALIAAGMADAYGVLKTLNAHAVAHNLRLLVAQVEADGNADRIVRHLPPWRRKERWRKR